MFTIGNYSKRLQSNISKERVYKQGMSSDYTGGIVFRTKEHAIDYIEKNGLINFKVYELIDCKDTDIYLHKDGNFYLKEDKLMKNISEGFSFLYRHYMLERKVSGYGDKKLENLLNKHTDFYLNDKTNKQEDLYEFTLSFLKKHENIDVNKFKIIFAATFIEPFVKNYSYTPDFYIDPYYGDDRIRNKFKKKINDKFIGYWPKFNDPIIAIAVYPGLKMWKEKDLRGIPKNSYFSVYGFMKGDKSLVEGLGFKIIYSEKISNLLEKVILKKF